MTSGVGLKLSIRQLFQATKKRKQNVADADFFSMDEGIATLQFPHETIPVPDNGRYKLHNEIDDCIVCDKCAKVCPVNCIDIVPIRSPEVFGETSDGTAKRIYAETFDIDMAKCMFCGLCTTVCPTECLTMTNEYDYSTMDIRNHIFPFDNMFETDVKEKTVAWDKYQEEKLAKVAEAKKTVAENPKLGKPKAMAKPKTGTVKPAMGVVKPKLPTKSPTDAATPKSKMKPATGEGQPSPKPVFRPKVKPRKPSSDD